MVGCDGGVFDTVSQLVATEIALTMIGVRRISSAEADQALWNRHVVLRNRRGHADRLHHEGRRLLIGRTDGGRWLTFVIEQTTDPTTWSLVTGWDSTPRERMLMEKHGPYRR